MTVHDDPDFYRFVWLGQTVSPPLAFPGGITGHDDKVKWDVQEAKGTTGATSVLVGDVIKRFRTTFFLADDEDEQVWEAFADAARTTTSSQPPKTLPLWHPDTSLNGIGEVARETIGGITRDEKGGATTFIDWIAYKPPKPKASSKATGGTSSGTGKDTKPDPNAAAKAELDRLLDQAQGVPPKPNRVGEHL